MKRSQTRRRVRVQETAWHVGLHDTRLDVSAEQIVNDLTSMGRPARRIGLSKTPSNAPR